MVVGQSTLWHDKAAIRGDWQFFIFNHKVVVHYNETKREETKWHKDTLQGFINCYYCLMCVWFLLNGYGEPTMC